MAEEKHFFVVTEQTLTPFLFNLTRWCVFKRLTVANVIKRLQKRGIRAEKRSVSKYEGSKNWFLPPEEYLTALVLEDESPVSRLKIVNHVKAEFIWANQ